MLHRTFDIERSTGGSVGGSVGGMLSDSEVKTLGEKIVTSQTAQITLMKDMLSRI